MNKLAIVLGTVLLVAAVGLAPVPLTETLEEPTRYVTIYPNVLLAAPLMLLGALLMLYAVTVNGRRDT